MTKTRIVLVVIGNLNLVFGRHCIMVLVYKFLSFGLYFGLYIRMIGSM